MPLSPMPEDRQPEPGGAVPGMVWIWGLIGLSALVEAILWAGDLGVFGPLRLRETAYEYGGFWPGLLAGWKPNYPGQAWAMFVTYGFLHGGPVHLAVNMLTLWSLGRAVLLRVGVLGFLLLYFATMIGGAGGYALLSSTVAPMVGASGALFGLAGGLIAWDYVDRYTLRARRWPVLRVILLLVAMNVAMWWGLKGQLAWQTHLGGFVIGWVVALLIDPRGRQPALQGPG